MSTPSEAEAELIPDVPAKWTVVTKYHDPKNPSTVKHYELRYQDALQDKRKGIHGCEVLKLVAKHLNRINATPRPRIQCAADAPNPQKYLAAHTW